MTLEVTVVGIVALSFTMAILILFSIMDLLTRRVRNGFAAAAILFGIALGYANGHLTSQILLHITAVIFVTVFVIVLFRMGAIGGADAKAALAIAAISPGIEFGVYENVFFEAVIGGGLQLVVMLILGYLYQMKEKDNPERKPAPLIPFLLIGYLLVQLLALV